LAEEHQVLDMQILSSGGKKLIKSGLDSNFRNLLAENVYSDHNNWKYKLKSSSS
jgi:hypothetical protein